MNRRTRKMIKHTLIAVGMGATIVFFFSLIAPSTLAYANLTTVVAALVAVLCCMGLVIYEAITHRQHDDRYVSKKVWRFRG